MLKMIRGRLARTCLCILLASAGTAAFSVAQALGALPDNRAYELVSPQDKNGGDVTAESTRTRASADGNAVQYLSQSGFAGVQGTGIAAEYIAVRNGAAGTQGWTTHGITPPQEPLSLAELVFGKLDPRYVGEMSQDLSQGVFLANSSLATDAPNVDAISKLYMRDDLLTPGDGHYQVLSNCLSAPLGPCAAPIPVSEADPAHEPAFAGASADFRHVIFESSFNFTNDASGSLPKLYEWDHGTLRLAGILPDDACGTPPCPGPSSAAGQGANPDELQKHYTPNTISQDGTRIVFTSPVDGASRGTADSNLYLRQNHATTVQLNASERTNPTPTGPATFQAATPDLSRIYFLGGQLTDQPGSGLYVYDARLPDSDPHNLHLITSSVTGVIGVSNDGSYIYFVTESQLPGSNTLCDPTRPCIYVWHDGTLKEVAPLNINIEERMIIGTLPWSNSPMRARVTPGGTHLVFVSEGTPDESPAYDHGSCQGAAGLLPYFGTQPGCAEVYMYDATADAGAGKLTCVSCNPSGVQASSTDADFTIHLLVGSYESHLNHVISDDGRFVFFDTGERLVPEDKNSVYDVYEYDTVKKQAELISSGTGTFGSYFLDASANGENVFFRTRDRLVGWDKDDQADLYDARIGGGFPDPVTPQQCQGQGCRGPVSAPPTFPDPGTGTFHSRESRGQGGGQAAVFHVFALGHKKLARWAKSGVVELRVRASDAGRVSARVRGRLGGHVALLAKASKRLRGGGTIDLRLRLPNAALASLKRTGHLRLTIRVGYSQANAAQTLHATLTAP